MVERISGDLQAEQGDYWMLAQQANRYAVCRCYLLADDRVQAGVIVNRLLTDFSCPSCIAVGRVNRFSRLYAATRTFIAIR